MSRGPSERLTAEVEALARRIKGRAAGGDKGAPGGILSRARPPGAPLDPIERLAKALGLSPVEADLIVLAGLPEEGAQYAKELRELHPQGEARPTVALAIDLFCADAAERVQLRQTVEDGAAVRGGVLRLEGEGRALPDRNVVLADGLWSALHGLDVWPGWLAPPERPAVTAGLELWFATPEINRLCKALAGGEKFALIVVAETEDTAVERAAALAARAKVDFARFNWSATPPPHAEGTIIAHAATRGIVPILRVPWSETAPVVPPSFEPLPGPVILCGRSHAIRPRGTRGVLVLPIAPLRLPERAAMWHQLLPGSPDVDTLAARYWLEPAAAAEVARDATTAARRDGRPVVLDDVALAVRDRAAATLVTGVKLVHPTARWENLILRRELIQPLREATDRLLRQGTVLDEWRFLHGRPGARGVRMLLSGPPGTGKSLSAEVMAAELGLDLLVVDISRVVSKWIGETEKNLAQVFDVAERANAVLLFDEADALFGKRTEVSDAHDRYANLETAYLLSRLERFDGLAVLTTNFPQNIDRAFLRRLEFVVGFEAPGVAEREALWRAQFPPTAPVADDVHIEELALTFPVVGALIRNAAVAAAYLAASDGGEIRRRHLVHAMSREYDKAHLAFPQVS